MEQSSTPVPVRDERRVSRSRVAAAVTFVIVCALTFLPFLWLVAFETPIHDGTELPTLLDCLVALAASGLCATFVAHRVRRAVLGE